MAARQAPVIDDDWEDLDWEDVTPPTPEPVQSEQPVQPAERSLLGQGWDAISQPLWEGPSRFAKSVGDSMGEATPEDWTIPLSGGATWKGLGQGMLQGAGDVVSSLTSPIDLGAALMSGGSSLAARRGLTTIGKGLAYGAKGAGGLVAAHGAGNVLSPDSSLAERGMGLAEIAGGVAGMHTPTARTAGIPEPTIRPKTPITEPPITAESMNDFFNPPPVAPVVPETGGPRPGKPRMVRNNDGTYTNMDTGEVLNSKGLPIEVAPETPETTTLYRGGHKDYPDDWQGDPYRNYTPDITHARGFAESRNEPMNQIDIPTKDLETFRNQVMPNDVDFNRTNAEGQYETGAPIYSLPRELSRTAREFSEYPRQGKPGAKYAYLWPEETLQDGSTGGGFHMYNVPVEGGGMTTVDAATVAEMGYALPEIGPQPVRPASMPALGDIGESIRSGPLDPILTTNINTGMKSVGRGTTDLGTNVRQIPDELPIEQAGPTMDETNGLIDEMGNNLQSLPPRGMYGDDPNFVTGSLMQPQLPAQAGPNGPPMGPPNKPPVIPPTLPPPDGGLPPKKSPKDVDPNSFNDPYAEQRAEPVGTQHEVSPGSMDRKKMIDAIKLGYTVVLDDNGKIILKKIKESPALQHMDDPNLQQSTLLEIANLPRTLMASLDMSAPLRQGIGLIHKKAFWTSLPTMFKAFGSEEAYKLAQKSIFDDPMFKRRVTADGIVKKSYAEDVGLKMTDLNGMNTREESMMSGLAERIPGLGRGVRASNRAYTVFLNKLRADTFKQMTKDFEVFSGTNLKRNVATAKDIATFINDASGRGKLPFGLEASAKNLSAVLFSPRLMASRLNMMAKSTTALFSPEVYMMSRPNVRREYLKSLATIGAVAGSFTQLMQLAGAEVETDPASSDFGKPRIGNTRIDPYGGFQQYVVAMQRLMPSIDLSSIGLEEIGGRMKSSTTGVEYDLTNPEFGQSNQADVLLRFVRSKSNPIINFGWGLMAGRKEISGKPMNFTSLNPMGEQGENLMDNSIAQRFMPMLTQDIYEMVQDEVTPLPAKIGATALAGFGMGSQTYGPD